MWVAKFKLRDDNGDIYSPLCEKHKIDFFAVPYTQFTKNNKINLLVGGVLSGSETNKNEFVSELKKDKRVKSVERHHDYIVVHVEHPVSRESRAEIKIFYNPQYILVKPVLLSMDGWEYWEIACLDRIELNKVINSAIKDYHGELFSIKEEKLKSVSSLEMSPLLTEKQFEAVKIAHDNGYYNYPRRLKISELAKFSKKAYSTFQENLRRAENKLIDYFFKYR